MMSRRLERVAAQIREELGLILPLVKHPDVGFVTFTSVDVSPDLSQAWVRISALPTRGHEDPAKSLEALRHSAPFIQRELGSRLRLRITPVLQFLLDRTRDNSGIEALIKQARATDPDHLNNAPDAGSDGTNGEA